MLGKKIQTPNSRQRAIIEGRILKSPALSFRFRGIWTSSTPATIMPKFKDTKLAFIINLAKTLYV